MPTSVLPTRGDPFKICAIKDKQQPKEEEYNIKGGKWEEKPLDLLMEVD